MAGTTTRRIVRETHFLASLALAVLLLFFASTGFMAEHRAWFHDRVDRDQPAPPVALDAPCDAATLAASLGPDAAAGPAPEGWLAAATSERAALCRPDAREAFHGIRRALPTAASDPALQQALDAELPGRFRDGGPDRRPDDGLWRFESVWGTRTLVPDPDRRRASLFTHRYPLAFSLIEVHRGRGDNARVLDVTAVLALVVALSGVWHGWHVAGRRRRWLLGMLTVGGVLGGVLLWA